MPATRTFPAVCRCGARTYPDQVTANRAEPSGAFKCPGCGTFALDHEFRGDASSDYRCWDCDTRSGSHGGPR